MKNTPVYLALGDSLSIDFYPELDAWGQGILRTDLGAASLLYRNDDVVWPEFAKRDVTTLCQGVTLISAAEDGARIEHLGPQALLARGKNVRLITVTIGGNDLLRDHERAGSLSELRLMVSCRLERLAFALLRIREEFPDAMIALTTIYDPTDGTGVLPRYSEPLPLEALTWMNDGIRKQSAQLKDCVLADVHQHFLGHGRSAQGADSWYMSQRPIEPGMRGASEIRSLWLRELEGAQFWHEAECGN